MVKNSFSGQWQVYRGFSPSFLGSPEGVFPTARWFLLHSLSGLKHLGLPCPVSLTGRRAWNGFLVSTCLAAFPIFGSSSWHFQ
jgi:hypothetical protein